MRSTILALLCPMLLVAGPACAADTDGDGISDEIESQLGLLPNVKQDFAAIQTSPDQRFTDAQAKAHAPDILSLEGCHVGGRRVLLKITFARPVDFMGASLIVYADLDNDPNTGRSDKYHNGVDVMFVFHDKMLGFTFYPGHDSGNTGARMAKDGRVLYLAIDAPFKQAAQGILPIGLHLLSQREGGRADSAPHVVARLPLASAAVPAMALGKGGTTASPSDYRYFGDKVIYEKLSDKGLREDQVKPVNPIQFGRPRPQVQYSSRGRRPDKKGSVDSRRVPVDLKEEAGVARRAAVLSFGFPLPQGALFRLDKIRLVEGTKEVPAQFTATAFWPDDSLKWVLIDATLPIQANAERSLAVEFGSAVRRAPTAAWEQEAPLPMTAALVDEHGKVYTATLPDPQASTTEQAGPEKRVITCRGSYKATDGSNGMQYIARLTQRRGSPLSEVALTTLNDCVKTEFTDITSLTLVPQRRGITQAGTYLEAGGHRLKRGPSNRIMQLDENTLAGGPGQGAGVVTWDGGGAVVHDFWQRYPKGMHLQDGQIAFDLLPKQPSPNYGKDLPYWDMFNLCEGKYRFKWGMAFTERIGFDFSGTMKPEELWAEAQMPLVPVIPASYYAETKAVGPVATPRGKQFAQWDKFVVDSLKNYMAEKKRSREYGFLNYGDWFGERGRNWGNNEYDLAHGLFMHFVRTGDRDAFRWAVEAAQHRADVDTIWFYPDPRCVGANPPHSIGHCGMWTQTLERIGWSCRYDSMYTASNGHNWCDGLIDDWFLTGNPRAMESALAFGEHVAYAMAPSFKQLGTHERSAGWSLRSILAVYKATYDPVYLEAARKIAAVALREQKFDQGGAWPHVLPRDHAGDSPGAVGNNLFLMGILLGGLQAYHEETRDPAVLKSLTAGAAWVAGCYDAQAGGWPYSCKADGTPLYRASIGLNQLILCPVAYVGLQTNDQRLLQIASDAMAAAASASPGGNGKGLAQFLFFTSGTLAELQQWYAKTLPDKGLNVLDGSPESMVAQWIRTASSDRHNVRAPDRKTFYVRLKQDIAELTLRRTPHGAMPKRAEFAAFQVLDTRGRVVAHDKCSTDDKHEFKVPLVGKGPQQFRVVVEDDQRGVWTLSSDGLQIMMQAGPDLRIGGVGRSRFYFMVPKGTREFVVKVVGVHAGLYAALVLDPTGKPAGSVSGSNPGPTARRGAEHPEWASLTVKPAAEQTGRVWSVILTASGDMGVSLKGVPSCLMLSPRDWFEVE